MSVATVKLLKSTYNQFEFYGLGRKDPSSVARRLVENNAYTVHRTIGVPLVDGEAAAEEVFDLTNNPSREDERTNIFGNGRSVSVGDIINVDGVDFLCAPIGWVKL